MTKKVISHTKCNSYHENLISLPYFAFYGEGGNILAMSCVGFLNVTYYSAIMLLSILGGGLFEGGGGFFRGGYLFENLRY